MGNPLIALYKQLPENRKQVIGHYFSGLKKIARFGLELRFKVYEDLAGKNLVYLTPDEPDAGLIEYFFPGITVTRVRTVWAWSLPACLRQHEKVMIAINPRLVWLLSGGILTFPWIRQSLDLTTRAEEVLGTKWILREKKKAGKFEPLFSTDQKDLDLFYDGMYVAYIKKRFAGAVFIKKVFFEKSLGTSSELCMLKKDDLLVAGALFEFTGDRYVLLTLGVTDEALVKEGATSALYYYGICRARERGARYFDFGLSRPFIFDGVLNYKRRWGGELEKDRQANHVMYLKNISRDGLIVPVGERFRVLVSAEDEANRLLATEAGLETGPLPGPVSP